MYLGSSWGQYTAQAEILVHARKKSVELNSDKG